MNRGYVILAQNSKDTDYIRMAYALALSIKATQTSVNQVALCTTETNVSEKYAAAFDHVISVPWTDQASESSWKIENKWKYYYMSPFDETVVLDADMIFPTDISHWWDIMSKKEMWITDNPRTFRGEVITSNLYRKTFESNQLPNVYTAFMYFKKTQMTGELFKLVELIFENWERFFYEYLDESRPAHLSGDVAYALAIKILGIESDCFGHMNSFPTFVHMKSFLQNVDEKYITENWPDHFPTYFANNGTFKIGNYEQHLPFHYHIKDWLTADILSVLESRAAL
jgi:hypothetical protein